MRIGKKKSMCESPSQQEQQQQHPYRDSEQPSGTTTTTTTTASDSEQPSGTITTRTAPDDRPPFGYPTITPAAAQQQQQQGSPKRLQRVLCRAVFPVFLAVSGLVLYLFHFRMIRPFFTGRSSSVVTSSNNTTPPSEPVAAMPSLMMPSTQAAASMLPSNHLPSSAPSVSLSPGVQPPSLSSNKPTTPTLSPLSQLPQDSGGQPFAKTQSPSSSWPTATQFDSFDPTTSPPSLNPSSMVDRQTVTFFAIGDVPYTTEQAEELEAQLQLLPDRSTSDNAAEFVVHVGDIRSAAGFTPCQQEEYDRVAELLQESPVPVFIVLGDNEWNDCPNPNQAQQFWRDTFSGFERRHWDPIPSLHRLPSPREEDTFAFVYKGSLFIGLNLVGGRMLNALEWAARHTEQVEWTLSLLEQYPSFPTILLGHAQPTERHSDFFQPIQAFLRTHPGRAPLLYLHGDRHRWNVDTSFRGQANWYRITLRGGSSELPLQVNVRASDDDSNIFSAEETFSYNREWLE